MPNENFRVPFEESLLRLRFIGDELEYRSVPIYELGNTLVAIQRIVNKAYLLDENRLDRAARPSGIEREGIALQLASRKKASDGYGLTPILTNPAFAGLIDGVVKAAVSALAAYVLGTVLSKKKEEKPKNTTLVVSIYPEVKALTERIGDGAGKVTGLEISQGPIQGAKPILVEARTKSYVKAAERGTILGPKMEMRGYVKKLFLETQTVEIRTEGRRIKVRLRETEFSQLKERARSDSAVLFIGHPIFRLGVDSSKFTDFSADRFRIPRLDRSS